MTLNFLFYKIGMKKETIIWSKTLYNSIAQTYLLEMGLAEVKYLIMQ